MQNRKTKRYARDGREDERVREEEKNRRGKREGRK